MGLINICVNYKDREYSAALKQALALSCKDFNFTDSLEDSIVIDEMTMPLFMPVPDIVSKIMAMTSKVSGPAKLSSDVFFTGFCSGIGGAGLSVCSLAYAKIKSRIFKQKISYISFDPWFRHDFPSTDEYGVCYLQEIPASLDSDELVLDIPYGYENFANYIDMCDLRVVVMGYDEKRNYLNDIFYNILLESSSKYVDPPKTYKFYNHFDLDIDSFDIHSQLGKEMLEFINSLKEENA